MCKQKTEKLISVQSNHEVEYFGGIAAPTHRDTKGILPTKFKKHKKTWKIFTLEEKPASQDDKKFKRVGSIQNTGTLQKF